MQNWNTIKTWSKDILDTHVFITESKSKPILNGYPNIFEAVVEYGGETYTKDFIGSFYDALEALRSLFNLNTPYGKFYLPRVKLFYPKPDGLKN